MSAMSCSAAVEHLSRRNIKDIDVTFKQHTDVELAELADCLLAHPDVVTRVDLAHNQLTDQTGIKLARYLAASTTIEWLDLSRNQFGSGTYLALAAALRLNSSLRCLYLNHNQAVDRTRIDAAFIEALRLNPDRPTESWWWLYSFGQDDFPRFRAAADELDHPSMLHLLLVHKAPFFRPAPSVESPIQHSDDSSCHFI